MTEVEYVNVPVPKHLVPRVYELISSYMVTKGEAKPTEGATEHAASEVLSDETLKRMWDESAAVMRKALKHLAQQSGKPVAAPDLAKAIFGNPKGHKLAGAMGAFGRRCQNRYGGAKPFAAKWNPVATRWEYTMPADVAKRIASY